MNKKTIRKLRYGALGCIITKEFPASGWHIDDVDKSLNKNKKNWLKKAFEFYPISYFFSNHQSQFPWPVHLIIYLKPKRKNLGFNYKTIHDLKKELYQTPPEFVISAKELPNDGFYLKPNYYDFLPKNMEALYFEDYDKREKSYFRTLRLTIKREHFFRLMILKMFYKKSMSELLNEIDSPRLIRNIDLQRIKKLEELIKQDPSNSKVLTEYGTLLFIAMNNHTKAIKSLRKAIKLDNKNIDAHFWLALCLYYFLGDTQESLELINKALEIDLTRSDCLNFKYRLLYHSTIDLNAGLIYLKEAIKYSPNWVLPRIQYVLYAIAMDNFSLAEVQINELKNLLINSNDAHLSDDILERFIQFYIKGNVQENLDAITDLEKIIKKWRKDTDKIKK